MRTCRSSKRHKPRREETQHPDREQDIVPSWERQAPSWKGRFPPNTMQDKMLSPPGDMPSLTFRTLRTERSWLARKGRWGAAGNPSKLLRTRQRSSRAVLGVGWGWSVDEEEMKIQERGNRGPWVPGKAEVCADDGGALRAGRRGTRKGDRLSVFTVQFSSVQ